MSSSSELSLFVIDRRDLANFYGTEVAALLAGQPVALDSQYLHHYESLRKKMNASTRGDWFKVSMKELLDLSGIEHLRFMSEQSHTHKYLEVDRSHPEVYDKEIKTLHEYTVIKKDFKTIIKALNALASWCSANPDRTDLVLVMDYPESAIESLENSFFTLNPNGDLLYENEGQGSLFFFCVLRTIGDLLRYAEQKGLWVIYDNAQMVYET